MNSGPIDVRNVETFCGLTLDEILAKVKEEGIGGDPVVRVEAPVEGPNLVKIFLVLVLALNVRTLFFRTIVILRLAIRSPLPTMSGSFRISQTLNAI